MTHPAEHTEPGAARRPYRPPIGIPGHGEPRAQATVAAVALHLLILLVIAAPTLFVSSKLLDIAQQQGAGGAGPVGGGGGGTSGGADKPRIKFIREHVDYVRVATPEPPKLKVEPPKPKPEEVKPPPPVAPPAPVAAPAVELKPVVDSAGASRGAGAGTGNDGTTGSGPGRGGGVGSGDGTGRGSGNGPGTGGGTDAVYPPTVIALPILPLPIPSKVRPYKMIAQFEVDSAGNAKLLAFNPSRDSGYNRRIREMLMEIRFRPAVRPDGTPVKAFAVVTAEAM